MLLHSVIFNVVNLLLIMQIFAVPEEWNDKVVAALMVIKRALLKEENDRLRAEAEWKLEIKKLTQRIQTVQDNTHNSPVPQVFSFQRSHIFFYMNSFTFVFLK
jgi:hypothetical protein